MDEFDTKFKRMPLVDRGVLGIGLQSRRPLRWEYYLSCCAAAFEKRRTKWTHALKTRRRRTKVWQMVWTKQLSTRWEAVSVCQRLLPGWRIAITSA